VDGTPTIDVIVPTRNRFEFTETAIRSVEAQTHRAWNLYVVDDASDDGSSELLEQLIGHDARMHMIRLDTNRGAAAARQVGLEAGAGDLVATLDSDDVWMPTKLEKQLRHFCATADLLPDVGAVLCGHCWTNDSLEPSPTITTPPPYSRRPLVSNNMSTLLAARSMVEAAGGFSPDPGQRFSGCEGIENYIRFSEFFAFVSVAELLVLCRSHDQHRESDIFGTRAAAENLELVLELHAEHLSRFPEDHAEIRALLGARYLSAGDKRAGLRQLARALRAARSRQRLRLITRYAPFTVKELVRI
jgi:glycosyltransferase involved in cell wall biosynthesis